METEKPTHDEQAQAPDAELTENQNIFDVGSFTIPYLSADPRGFEVITDTSLHRRDHEIDPDSGHEHPIQPLSLTEDERPQLRRGMGNEAYFTLPDKFPQDKKPLVQQYFKNIDTIATLKREGKTGDDFFALLADQRILKDELRPIFHEFKLKDQLGLKVGVRNIRQEGRTLTIDTRPISYPLYAIGANPENSPETLDLSAVTGSAAILVTADNKIILQHRSAKNSPYGDMPGASFAGMVDGTMADEDDKNQDPGTLKPITTETINESSKTESLQEIALGDEDFIEFRIVGQARDHVREHDEFLILTKTSLTAKEVAERAANAPRSRSAKKLDEHGDFHFEENFITIDATPNAIATLLTEVKCPLPPTHAAAFVAAGYNLVLEQSDLRAADAWKDRMQIGVKKNYEEMNRMVADYYEKFPSELEKNKSGKPRRNPVGYEPYYTPQEQGLPPLGPELIRVGLLV